MSMSSLKLRTLDDVYMQFAEVNPMVDNGIKMLREVADDLKNLGDDVNEEKLNTLREECKKLLAVKLMASYMRNLMEEASSANLESTCGEGADATTVFENGLSQKEFAEAYSNEQIIGSLEYLSFNNYLRKLFNLPEIEPVDEDDDDENMDVEVRCTQTNMVFKDPFTQKQIVEGVRNRICKHVYERGIIVDLLKINGKKRRKMMCPYAGCGNSNPLREQDLEAV